LPPGSNTRPGTLGADCWGARQPIWLALLGLAPGGSLSRPGRIRSSWRTPDDQAPEAHASNTLHGDREDRPPASPVGRVHSAIEGLVARPLDSPPLGRAVTCTRTILTTLRLQLLSVARRTLCSLWRLVRARRPLGCADPATHLRGGHRQPAGDAVAPRRDGEGNGPPRRDYAATAAGAAAGRDVRNWMSLATISCA